MFLNKTTMPRIKFKIRFGSLSYNVSEWLYNYFNKVKKKKDKTEYENLFKILIGVKCGKIKMPTL